jgi:hypothetical protein
MLFAAHITVQERSFALKDLDLKPFKDTFNWFFISDSPPVELNQSYFDV